MLVNIVHARLFLFPENSLKWQKYFQRQMMFISVLGLSILLNQCKDKVHVIALIVVTYMVELICKWSKRSFFLLQKKKDSLWIRLINSKCIVNLNPNWFYRSCIGWVSPHHVEILQISNMKGTSDNLSTYNLWNSQKMLSRSCCLT